MEHDEFFKPVRDEREVIAKVIAEQFDKAALEREHQRLKDAVMAAVKQAYETGRDGDLWVLCGELNSFERAHGLRD